ncbi:hypothetical protein BV898_14216 [Hypsibius exemplaris]|uniref:Large ribosomal subunit protein mL52 n=1 Tax=Hypsibius exemplaris TaxID=2072580 RepID=A0A1W0W8F5_HYPEX|nr:hypothetical protein BV898_14216 [Hypsibius exemplaris]
MLGIIFQRALPFLPHHFGEATVCLRHFSASSTLWRNTQLSRGNPTRIQEWREKRDIPRSGNEYGPLTDLPDWSYEDGRPGPLNRQQRARLDRSERYAQQINFLLSEVDSAVNTHAANQRHLAEERERIIRNKLREKGTPFRAGTAAVKSDKSPPKTKEA